jgi:hypothetical protein
VDVPLHLVTTSRPRAHFLGLLRELLALWRLWMKDILVLREAVWVALAKEFIPPLRHLLNRARLVVRHGYLSLCDTTRFDSLLVSTNLYVPRW